MTIPIIYVEYFLGAAVLAGLYMKFWPQFRERNQRLEAEWEATQERFKEREREARLAEEEKEAVRLAKILPGKWLQVYKDMKEVEDLYKPQLAVLESLQYEQSLCGLPAAGMEKLVSFFPHKNSDNKEHYNNACNILKPHVRISEIPSSDISVEPCPRCVGKYNYPPNT